MKKLNLNIEDIYINGRPERLTEIITDIDKRMQDFANETELIKSVVVNYGGANYGKQYNFACEATNAFSADVYAATDVLNDLQHQVADFENQCHIFEGEAPSAVATRHNVSFTELASNTAAFRMQKAEMMAVSNALGVYSASASETCMRLYSNRDAICSIWLDTQSRDFSDCIDEICGMIEAGRQVFDDYKGYLDGIIKTLT